MYLQWLEKRREIERERITNDLYDRSILITPTPDDSGLANCQDVFADDLHVIISPGPKDVLFGRGKLFQEHPGNQELPKLMEEYAPKFDAALKIDKHCLPLLIVSKVTETS